MKQMGSGSTVKYVYDAMNRRVRTQTTSATLEYLFDAAGKRTSTWNTSNAGIEGRIYWDGKQIAYRASDGNTYFEHQDWLGTERMRTTYTGTVAASFSSLPWGDGYTALNITGQGGQDSLNFATLDYDSEDSTSHAQYRNYSPKQGRWLRPDPYSGSYDFSNPQSFNRYSYALNNPLAFIDPNGLDCIYESDDGEDGGIVIVPGDCPTDSEGNPTDNGSYVDATGVTAGYFDENGDLGGYQVGDAVFDAAGDLMPTFDLSSDTFEVTDSTNNFMDTVNSMYGFGVYSQTAPNNGPSLPWKTKVNIFLSVLAGPLPSCHALYNIGDVLEWGSGGILASAGVAAIIPGGQAYAGGAGAVGGVIGFVGVTADKASKHGLGCW